VADGLGVVLVAWRPGRLGGTPDRQRAEFTAVWTTTEAYDGLGRRSTVVPGAVHAARHRGARVLGVLRVAARRAAVAVMGAPAPA
jgi:hypothetical protein